MVIASHQRLPLCVQKKMPHKTRALTKYIQRDAADLDRTTSAAGFESFTSSLLNLKALPSQLDLRLYSVSFGSNPREVIMTIQGTSLFNAPNPIHRTVSNARDWILKLVLAAEDILLENNLDVRKAPDLVMLTSAWDRRQATSRRSMGLEEQLDAIRFGYTWQSILPIEAEGIPLTHRKDALKLPAELREALYPKPSLMRTKW